MKHPGPLSPRSADQITNLKNSELILFLYLRISMEWAWGERQFKWQTYAAECSFQILQQALCVLLVSKTDKYVRVQQVA